MFFSRQYFVLRSILAGCLLLSGFGVATYASVAEAGSETLYQDIETVEVTAFASNGNAQTGSLTQISPSELNFMKPTSLADVFALVPSANVRVNSRGETLVSIRGAGERQQTVFLDGAPVNVPWDNRFDLRLIPALAIGDIRVIAGPNTAMFGANASGGVVDIAPTSTEQSEILLEGGRGNQWLLEAKTGITSGKVRSTVAVGHFATDGLAAPGGRDSAYSPSDNSLITNTDRKQTSIFVRSVAGNDASNVGLSVLYYNAAFGIAPEQGPRVEAEDARYWRFPDTEHLIVSGNIYRELTDRINLLAVGWFQKFNQRINSFEGATYGSLEDVQQDKNNTTGARVRIGFTGARQQFSFSASSAWASHEQQEFEPEDTVRPVEEFSQFTASIGGDYARQLNNSLSLSVSAAYDLFDPGKTAGRGSGTKFDGFRSSLQLDWAASDQWHFRIGAGRAVRLPTMRELFGEAIGRFLINPDLEPELSWQFEAGVGFRANSVTFDITPFLLESRQALDQTRVVIDDQSLRQRVNLPGSRTYGVEARGQWQVSDDLSLSGHATWSKSRVKPESVAKTIHRLYLSDRPNWLAQAGAEYQVGVQTTFGLSVVYRGTAKSEDDAGVFLDLSAATQVNMMLSHKIKSAQNGFDMELFARFDNLTDTFFEPQLGLPAAGRSFKLGLKTVF